MTEPQLLTRRQAAIRSGINPKHFNYVVQQEPFSSYLIEDKEFQWLVDSEIIPKIKDYYKTHKEAFHYYNDHPDYMISYRIAMILNKTNQELLTEIHKGKWDDMIEKVPRISPSKTSYGVNEAFNYFFDKSKFFQNQYCSIEQIATHTTLISRSRLHEYRKLGLLPQPNHLKGTNLFVESEILELIPKLKLDFVSQRQNSGPDVPLKAFDLLSASQQQMISKYIRFRETGGVIEYGGYRSSPSVANKFVSLEKMKSRISSALLLIISGRCEIEEDFHHNPLCRNEIPAAYNPEVFDILSVTKDDYPSLAAKRTPLTLHQIYHNLRPFYYFVLENLEEEAVDCDDLVVFRNYRRIALRIQKFLQQFPHTKNEINLSDYKQISKTFLTREQMVIIKQYILEDVRSKDPVKNATMWQISCTIGVRPEELTKLEINHFQLDADGFIWLDQNGWGLLKLPASVSKKNNSPSHPEYHTPVPISTVAQLNRYLKRLYKLQGDNNPKGKGFLFRPDYALPMKPYKRMRFEFINRIRERLNFLDENQKQDFIFKTSRHSLNNTIMRTYIKKDPSLNEAKRTASDHQLRHKPSKTVGEEYYLSDISKEQYYQVLDLTINFPWEIEELHQWEVAMGYRTPLNPFKQVMDTVLLEENREFRQELQKIEQQLEEYKEKPQHLSEQSWIKERQLLLKQKKMLITKIQGGE